MDEGPMVVIVQASREPPFNIGERVRVYTNSYGAARVFHSDEDSYIDLDTKAYLPEDFENPDLWSSIRHFVESSLASNSN